LALYATDLNYFGRNRVAYEVSEYHNLPYFCSPAILADQKYITIYTYMISHKIYLLQHTINSTGFRYHLATLSSLHSFKLDLPVQLYPSPVYPGRQVHVKLPGLLVQVAIGLQPPLFSAHSSISTAWHVYQ